MVVEQRLSSCRPHLRLVLVPMVLLHLLGCTSSSLDLDRDQRPLPGPYDLSIRATSGSRVGQSTAGPLQLKLESAPSPAQEYLWGYTDVDFSLVGAPIVEDESAPSPNSNDPLHPGVILAYRYRAEHSTSRTPVLLIGTVENRTAAPNQDPEASRNLLVSSDGGGIGLWIESVSDSTFRGRWSEWGILKDGSGTFTARRRTSTSQ